MEERRNNLNLPILQEARKKKWAPFNLLLSEAIYDTTKKQGLYNHIGFYNQPVFSSTL